MIITKAEAKDLRQILDLQYLAYQSEAMLLNNFSIQPLIETIEELSKEYQNGIVLKCFDEHDVIIGSVRGYVENNTLNIGKLIVHPGKQGMGIGSQLLNALEQLFPECRYELFTSSKSIKNLRFYEGRGYIRFKEKNIAPDLMMIYLEKQSLKK